MDQRRTSQRGRGQHTSQQPSAAYDASASAVDTQPVTSSSRCAPVAHPSGPAGSEAATSRASASTVIDSAPAATQWSPAP